MLPMIAAVLRVLAALFDKEGSSMSNPVEVSLTRMMTWRARAIVPTVLLLALGLISMAVRLEDGLAVALGLVSLVVLFWAVPLWIILVGAVFRTGQRAFGAGAGLVYAVLTVVLMVLFGAGVFVIPLMVRADIRRLHGGPLENNDQPPNAT